MTIPDNCRCPEHDCPCHTIGEEAVHGQVGVCQPQLYKNLTYEDSVRFEALTMVIAHWPEDRKCLVLPWSGYTHYHGSYPCYYGFVFQQYSELHMKEFGCHAT